MYKAAPVKTAAVTRASCPASMAFSLECPDVISLARPALAPWLFASGVLLEARSLRFETGSNGPQEPRCRLDRRLREAVSESGDPGRLPCGSGFVERAAVLGEQHELR